MPTATITGTTRPPEIFSALVIVPPLSGLGVVVGFVAWTWIPCTTDVADATYEVDEKEHWDMILSVSIEKSVKAAQSM